MRFTANVGESAQFYAMANFYKTDTFASFTPLGLQRRAAAAEHPDAAPSANVILPVYVCVAGVGTFNGLDTGCNAGNGVLNPYNPYAADRSERAQLLLRHPMRRTVDTSSRAMRVVAGLEGSFGEGWRYSANFTASEVEPRPRPRATT